MSLNILHLFANWKWTGPAEPAANLCRTLAQRRHKVILACGQSPKGQEEQGIAYRAGNHGIEIVTEIPLQKHLRVRNTLQCIRSLTQFLNTHAIDVVHTHLRQDHLVAAWARRKAGQVPIVRTSHYGTPMPATLRAHYLIRQATDALIVVSEMAAKGDAEQYALSTERVHLIHAAVDCNRFAPQTPSEALRKELGISKEHVVVGMVARFQTKRRFDLLLQAFARAYRLRPKLRLLLVGRGEDRQTAIEQPARELGIQDAVIFAGIRRNDYPDVLALMDFGIYLAPGSDGSCRTVREFMAMSKPTIATRRGLLKELVQDRTTGLLIEENATSLLQAMLQLTDDAGSRKNLGAQARKHALEYFNLETQAAAVEKVYQNLVS